MAYTVASAGITVIALVEGVWSLSDLKIRLRTAHGCQLLPHAGAAENAADVISESTLTITLYVQGRA